MKILKLLLITAMLSPLFAYAQTRPSDAPISTTSSSDAKYPRYNDKEAAELWARKKHNGTFSQADYARVIDLCDASYVYLSQEIQSILTTTSSKSLRAKKASDLDMGITSNMSNFARTMANWIIKVGSEGALNYDNQTIAVEMIKHKKRYMELNQQLYHPF